MAWRLFQWGSRGLYYDTGNGVYVAHIFIPHGVQVTLFGHSQSGEELLHTFHAETVNANPDVTDCTNIAQAVHDWVIAAVNGFHKLCHVNIQFDRVLAQSIAEFEGPFAEVVIGANGTRTGTDLPSVLCMNVKKHSNTAGRSHRGYFATWPAVTADLDSTDANRFDAGYVTDCLDVYGNLLSALAAASAPLVIASRARTALYGVTAVSVVTPAVRSRESRGEGIGR